MVETVETYDGWYTLHDFRVIDWEKWQQFSNERKKQALKELHVLLEKWQQAVEHKQGSHGIYQVAGNKADFMFMVLRPEMKDLIDWKTELNKLDIAHVLTPADSFVSIVEKSSYTKPEQDPYTNPEMLKKLYPAIPKKQYICFYPMSKKRGETENWFTLYKNERGRMMFDHIKTAKPYTENVKRIITGAMGLDDYEWGVSLFSDDPLQFKKLIYDTRFDEVSAKYGVFGSFYIGSYLEEINIDAYFS